MIFNKREMVDTLMNILHKCGYDMNEDELLTLRMAIHYFEESAPKLTFDEFKALFDCKAKYLDDETVELEVTPKKKCYAKVIQRGDVKKAYSKKLGIEVCLDYEEDLLVLAHSQFIRHVGEVKE